MVTKKSKAKQRDSEKMINDIRERLEDTFLAGLGAFSNAQDAGEKTFNKLVKEGEKFRKETSRKTESLIDDVQDAIRKMTEDAQSKASGLLDQVRGPRLDKFTEVFDKRIVDAMDRLQMATKKDVEVIEKKLSKIEKLLDEKKPAVVEKPAPKQAIVPKQKTPIKKTAPKQAA